MGPRGKRESASVKSLSKPFPARGKGESNTADAKAVDEWRSPLNRRYQ
jgi:hypothetical protein